MAEADTDSPNLAYARALIELIGEDARRVYIRVTAAVGLAGLFVTQLPFDRILALHQWARWVLALGLAAAVASGALLFYYSDRLHRARVRMLREIRDGHPEKVPDIWDLGGEVWKTYGRYYKAGMGALVVSLVLLGAALAALLKLFG